MDGLTVLLIEKRVAFKTARVETQLGFYAFAFHDSDVSVDRNFRKNFYAAAGLRPANLETIHFRPRADAQDFARIV